MKINIIVTSREGGVRQLYLPKWRVAHKLQWKFLLVKLCCLCIISPYDTLTPFCMSYINKA